MKNEEKKCMEEKPFKLKVYVCSQVSRCIYIEYIRRTFMYFSC